MMSILDTGFYLMSAIRFSGKLVVVVCFLMLHLFHPGLQCRQSLTNKAGVFMRGRGLWLLSIGLVLIALAGCRTGAGSIIPPTDDFGANSAITWDRAPDSITFRAEIVGGGRENEFAARNDIAPCTVYGDNRVVWTNEIGPFNEQVLFDQVSDDAVKLFIEQLTVIDQFFNYPARADLQLPSETVPVYEQIEVNVSGRSFKTDSFAGWPAGFYETVVNRCRSISQTPVLFEPGAGWLSAQEVPYDLEVPTYPWESTAAGVSLAEVAGSGERRWITDPLARILWTLVRTSPTNVQLIENDRAFNIAFEVPRVTRYAPPPQQ